VPWCDRCERYLTPTSLATDGTCPHCDSEEVLVEPPPAAARLPWHFWIIIVAATVYLGWRAVQGVVALAHWLL
jgi:hypothetical protein